MEQLRIDSFRFISFKLESNYSDIKEWRDSEKAPLESRLSNILAKLELEAERMKEVRIEREKWNLEYELKRKIEENRKQLIEKEILEFKNLKNNAKRWQEVTDIRNYINAVEKNAIDANSLTEDLKDWIQ